MLLTTRRIGLALMTLTLAAGPAACGGGDDPEAFDPARTTSTPRTTTAPERTTPTTSTPEPTTTAAPAPAPTTPSSDDTTPEAPAPTTTTAPPTGGAEAEPEPTPTTTTAVPQQNPGCRPGTGPGFPDRPQCEPVDGPDANEDEGP